MDKDLLKDAKEQFSDSSDAWDEARKNWLDDVEFARLGDQWPEGVRRQRELEGRPCLTINRLPSFIRQVVNDSRQNKPQLKTHPVDSGADVETAEIIGGLLRQIEISSNADVAYDTALDHAVSGGFGFFRVNVGYAHDDAFDQDLRIERVTNPLTVYWDSASTAADAEDWRYAFVTDKMPLAAFEREYKGADAVDWQDSYRDKDEDWISEEFVRVAEWWQREEVKRKLLKLSNGLIITEEDFNREIDGIPQAAIWQQMGVQVVGDRDTKGYKVTQRLMTGAEILKETEWAGKYIPIVPVFGEEVVIEGKRHFLSLTRHAKDAQQNFNYWRTAATELVALSPKAPWIGPRGAFNTDAQKWATANVQSHAYIEYDGPMAPQRQPFAGPPAGAIQEALNAADDMKSIMGIYDASLGAKSNETSGRAILARQRQGDVSTFHFVDNLSRGIRYAGRVLVDLIPKVYNTPRMLRIIGQDGTPNAVQINTQGAFDLTAGKYDVTVTVGPAFASQREEAMQAMLELIQVYPPAAPLLGDLIAKNSDWPNADEVAKRLKAMLPPQILQAEQSKMPAEAQAMMANLTQQLQGMQQQMQGMGQQMGQLQQENQSLQLQLQNKQGELQLKAQELQQKGAIETAKIQQAAEKTGADVETTRIEAQSEQIVAHIQEATKQMELRMQAMQQSMAAQKPVTVIAGADGAQFLQPRKSTKRMAITAPSGAVYQGVIEESEDE